MTEEATTELDPVGDAFGQALSLYGDQAHWVMSTEAFATLSGNPEVTTQDVHASVVKKAKSLGKALVFTVESGTHADLGESFWVTWWPGGVFSE